MKIVLTSTKTEAKKITHAVKLKKLSYLIIPMLVFTIMLTGCSSKNNEDTTKVQTLLETLYSIPYGDVPSTEEKSPEVLNQFISAVQDKFSDSFVESELAKHISTNTFLILQESAKTENIVLTVTDVSLEQTEDHQYSYTMQLKDEASKKEFSSKGSIRLDENGKIASWIITAYPDFVQI